jgi:hypothetical protein
MTTTSPPPPPPPPAPVAPPAAAPRPGPDLALRAPVALAAVAGAAVCVDLALTTELDGWAAFGAVLFTVVALVTSGWVRPVPAAPVAAAALAPALFLALRVSPWLLVLDVLAVCGLLALGAALAPGGDLTDTRFTTLGRQVGSVWVSLLLAPAAVVQTIARIVRPGRAGRTAPRAYGALARGLALTAPIVLILVVALASGDAVFASFVHISVDVESIVSHLAALVGGVWLVAGVLAHAARAEPVVTPEHRSRLGPLEGSVVLAGLILVYALFALARLLVALKGDRYVLETTGLTYAEYARSGFFQLLGAAALTVVVLLGLRATVDLPTARARRIFAVLAAVAVVLTVVMVQSATIRLALYDAAFGLTMLRLYSTIFAWWVAAVLVMVGLSLCGVGASRSWLPGAVAASALATLLVVNVINPEAVVVSRNLERHHDTGRFDVPYVATLSDDALAVLIDRRAELDDATRAELVTTLCRPYRRSPEPSANLSAQAGAAARARLCAPA